MKKRYYLVFIGILLFAGCAEKQPPASLDEMLATGIEQEETVGVSALVYENGTERYYAKGSATSATQKEIDGDTQFEIGSITKSFVSLLTMIAEKENLLTIDDPIGDFLPDGVQMPERMEQEIKIRHLLTHRSGFPFIPDNIRRGNQVEDFLNYTEQDLFEFLNHYELDSKPGESFTYSLVGYGLLGYILEGVYDRSLDELIESKITSPLNMDRTSINFKEHPDDNYAEGYMKGEVTNWYRNKNCVLNGSGGIRSTANDLLIYMKAQAGIIDTPLLECMKKTQKIQFEQETAKVCLGWLKNDDLMYHAGSSDGFFSFVALNQDAEKIFIILVNSNNQEWVSELVKYEMNFNRN